MDELIDLWCKNELIDLRRFAVAVSVCGALLFFVPLWLWLWLWRIIISKYDFHNFVFSMKASNPLVMVQAYRLLAAEQYR